MPIKPNIQSAKLLVLMDEFEKLMKEHDLGGAIIIHHKDESAYKLFMAPKYSIAEEQLDVDGRVIAWRFKTANLPKDIKNEMIATTCNLFRTVSQVMMEVGYGLAMTSDKLDASTNAKYSEPD